MERKNKSLNDNERLYQLSGFHFHLIEFQGNSMEEIKKYKVKAPICDHQSLNAPSYRHHFNHSHQMGSFSGSLVKNMWWFCLLLKTQSLFLVTNTWWWVQVDVVLCGIRWKVCLSAKDQGTNHRHQFRFTNFTNVTFWTEMME